MRAVSFAMSRRSVLVALLFAVPSCGIFPQGPLFQNIQGLTIQKITSDGLARHEVPTSMLGEVVGCLYNGTSEIDESQTHDLLLQDVFLLDITDNSGTRSFELYTQENFKGNGGKYYRNGCIHDLVLRVDRGEGPPARRRPGRL